MRVLHFPGAIGGATGGAAQFVGIIIPAATARDVRIGRGWFDPGIFGDGVREQLVSVGRVLVKRPLHHIAVHVVKAPGIGLFLADLLIFAVAVVHEPRVVLQLRRIVAE